LQGPRWIAVFAAGLAAAFSAAGCGLNKSRLATEQLVVSDAVDRAVAEIDFSPLSSRKVFLDTKYLDSVKLSPIGNVEYVISSLRQQMVAYDLRLMEKAEQAEFIVEARLGVMANDGHEVTYGIPGSAAMTTASVLLTAPVAAPAMPELSLGRRNHQQGTAKIGVFAYDRETREPVWQSGLAKGASRSRDLWMFGLGPFESRGPLRQTARTGRKGKAEIGVSNHAYDPLDAFSGSVVFERAIDRPKEQPGHGDGGTAVAARDASTSEKPADQSKVQAASHAEPAKIDHQNGPLKPVAGSP